MSVRQLDLQEAGKLTLKFLDLQRPKIKIFSRKLNFKIPKIDRVDLLNKYFFLKSKQTFMYTIDYDHRLTPFCQLDVQGPR